MAYGQKYEIHHGIVTDNEDPEKRGRLRVKCATLVKGDGELPFWVEAVYPFLSSSEDEKSNGGWFFTPNIGVIVELQVGVTSGHDELPGFTAMVAPQVKWRACLSARGSDVLDDLFKEHYPHRRGISTARGHALLFDDHDGTLTLMTRDSANKIWLDAEGDSIHMLDANGNAMDMDSDGWHWESANGDLIEGGSGAILFESPDIRAECSQFVVTQTGALQTPVIVDGQLGLQSLLGAALTEISGLIAGLGLVAVTTNTVVVPALQAGSFSSNIMSAE